jgi:lysophospholipase L1-like esterase
MALTNAYGMTSAEDLELGLYLCMETKVPEMVASSCNPFLLSLPMTNISGGADGARYTATADYTDNIAYNKINDLDADTDVVVLMIGTNDVNGNQPENAILDRYRQIVEAIRTTLPETKLYCVSMIPQNKQLEEYSEIDVDHTTEVILRLNPEIRQIAELAGAQYIDLFPLLADADNFLLPQYSDDGIHLNETGLAVWTEQMLPLLT